MRGEKYGIGVLLEARRRSRGRKDKETGGGQKGLRCNLTHGRGGNR